MPAEHGAWGMLAVPFLTAAMVAGAWNLPLLLCAVCALALFLLRGSMDAQGGGWRTLLGPAHLLLALAAAISAGALLLAYGRNELVPLAAIAVLLYFAQQAFVRLHELHHTEKRSLAAELVGVALLSLAAPAAWMAARGGLERAAVELWALNLVFFAGGVLYVKYRVRGVQAHRKFAGLGERLAFAWPVLVYHAMLAAFLLATITGGAFPALVLLAFAPGLLRALALVAQLGRRFPIRRLGWSEVVHAAVFAALLILAYRAG